MAIVELAPDISSGIFIEDMLEYVYRFYGMDFTSRIPNHLRLLFHLNYSTIHVFTPVLGDALVHMDHNFCSVADPMIYYANTRLRPVLNERLPAAVLLRCHNATALTTQGFLTNWREWCSMVFHFLQTVCTLCVYFEDRDPLAVNRIKTVAVEILHRVMGGLTFYKSLGLLLYAGDLLELRASTQFTVFDLN